MAFDSQAPKARNAELVEKLQAEARLASIELGTSLGPSSGLLATMRPVVSAEATALVPVELDQIAQGVLQGAAEPLADCDVEEVLEPVRAMALPPLLRQLLLNLVTNAGQAARTLPAPRVRVHVYASDGRAVVSVRDNGPGIGNDCSCRSPRR